MSRLRSQYVTVLLAQIGGLPAVVEADDDTEIVLSLAVQAPPGFQRVLDRPVRVECVSARGIQRVTGRAAWSPEHPDQLCVTRETAEEIQRREAVRVQAVAPAVVTVLALPPGTDGMPPAPFKTTSLNLSGTGVLVRAPDLVLGSRVRVELQIEPGEPPLVVAGLVVREIRDERAVSIDEISRPDQNRLSRYVTEKQRAELRMARA
jgi:PilZ domain-containing protein